MANQCGSLIFVIVWFLLSILFIVLTTQYLQPNYRTQCSNCPLGLSYCGKNTSYTPPKPYCCRHDTCENDTKNYCQSRYEFVYSCAYGWIILLEGVLSISIIVSLISCCMICFNGQSSSYTSPKRNESHDNYIKYQTNYIENMRKQNQKANWKNQYG